MRIRYPQVNDISTMSDQNTVWQQLEDGSGGWFGYCKEGFVRFWGTGGGANDMETVNVTMYFDSGEFWCVHGTAIADYKFGPTLRNGAVLVLWARTLRSALAACTKFGAIPVFKVQAGLFGVEGVRWPGETQSQAPAARKEFCVEERQSRDWSDEAQILFLTEAYAKVLDLFGLPPSGSQQVRDLLESLGFGYPY
jgi:hypothetical protein